MSPISCFFQLEIHLHYKVLHHELFQILVSRVLKKKLKRSLISLI